MSSTSSKGRVSSKRRRRGNSSVGLLVAIVAVVVLVFGAIAAVMLSQGSGDTEDPYVGLPQHTDTSIANGAVGFGIGEPDAVVTVVEYSDFSCPACYDLSVDLEEIIADYVPSGDVRVVFKPLSFINPATSVPAASAAYCAGQQGQFWQMQHAVWNLFFTRGTSAYTAPLLNQTATGIDGINGDEFSACLEADATFAALQGVVAEANALGINSTPTVFVNGQQVVFSTGFGADLTAAIDAALASN